jgi:hypothetical protein
MKKLLFTLIEQMRVLQFLDMAKSKKAGFYCSLRDGDSITVAGDIPLDSMDLSITPVPEWPDNPNRVTIRFKKRDKCPVFYEIQDGGRANGVTTNDEQVFNRI